MGSGEPFHNDFFNAVVASSNTARVKLNRNVKGIKNAQEKYLVVSNSLVSNDDCIGVKVLSRMIEKVDFPSSE